MPKPDRKKRVKNAIKYIIDGIEFSSKAEAYYYALLKIQLELGQIRGFCRQVAYELQPQFRKCSRSACNFIWEKPVPMDKRYKDAKTCPLCGHNLELIHSMTYISDFDVTYLDGSIHVIDVKSSPFFQTEIFKLKKKIFEYKFPDKRLEMVFPKVPKNWDPFKSIVYQSEEPRVFHPDTN
jgi:hypothetical protein